jgi:energy-coupling factor transporter ATP-binding protein EcfA2
MFEDNKITYFAETDYRNQKTKFGIKAKDRAKHMYVIGKTGVGKSTLLENLAIQDIQNDEGIIFIDPHGSSAVKLLDYIPRHRIDDVVYFAPHDTDFPIAFNPLEEVPKEKRSAIAGGIVGTMKKIWPDSFSTRMEYILMYTLLSLLEVPGSTFLGINRMLSDKVYRKYILDRVDDPLIKNFWFNEFDRYTATYVSEATAPIQNKIGQFIASPMLRNIIGQDVSTIDFRAAMDQKKILIINISKGIIGPENMRLLGGMLVTKIQAAAMSRASLDEESLKRIPPTYLYVDEFQNFANESFAEILSESRKYKLCLTVANQYIDQMTEEVRNAVIGNVGTFISFRVGSTDAFVMEKEFAPTFTQEDMVNLGFAQIYLKLMIDGMSSRPFSATTLPPIPRPSKSYVADILGYSRKHFGKTKEQVDTDIRKWSNKDFHLENVKFAEENRGKKKSVNGLGAIPESGRGVFLNEMGGYDALLQQEAERLKGGSQKPGPAKVASPKLDTKAEIDKIVEELMRGSDLPPMPPAPRTPRPIQSSVVKSGDMLGEQEISTVTPKLVLQKRDNQKRKKILNIMQQDFTHKKIVQDVAKTDTRQTKIPKKEHKQNSSDDEIPEDVLRALLDL